MTNRSNEAGSRGVFYNCSYVPEEIIMAAGLVPVRTIPRPRPAEADAYMHPNTCHYVKSLLGEALAGDASRASGIVFANSCDGMRRLHDVWKEYVKAMPALFLEVPKKKDPASVEFFASELRRFAGNLEEAFPGSKVTDKTLREAIGACNVVRMLMGDVFKLQRDAGSSVTGSSVFELCMEGACSHPAEFAGRLREFISSSKGGKVPDAERRILLTGNVVHRPDLIALIEELGGRVIMLDTCPGARHYDTLVEENSPDPMLALAERYLTKSSCARMEGIEERFQRLKRLAAESNADAVVYSTVKFCDTYLYEAPLMRNACEDAGMPFLFLENDYEWSGLGQMKTRVEAFLAMAAEREAS